jgi:hypothetical protein
MLTEWFAESPAFQILEKQGIALHPHGTPVLDICSVGWIGRICAAEMVDGAIVDFIKIEGAEKVVALCVLNLILHSAQIKVAPIQGAQLLCQSFLKTFEVSLFMASQAGTVGMRRSSRLFVGGTERFESVSKSLLLHLLIQAIIRFE